MVWQVTGELFRFGIVGLLSNGLLYLVYLALTSLGLGPKVSMTVAFISGVLQTFAANRTFTFRIRKAGKGALLRYFATYGIAYLCNLAVLILLVDELEFSHVVVQGATILGLALVMFLLQKYWVFAEYKESI
jgi:putative flippase GtrA